MHRLWIQSPTLKRKKQKIHSAQTNSFPNNSDTLLAESMDLEPLVEGYNENCPLNLHLSKFILQWALCSCQGSPTRQWGSVPDRARMVEFPNKDEA